MRWALAAFLSAARACDAACKEQLRDWCLIYLNAARAREGLPTIQRYKEFEECADAQAKRDNEKGGMTRPHWSWMNIGGMPKQCPNVPKTHGNFGTQICMPGGNYLAANSNAETAIRNAVAFWWAEKHNMNTAQWGMGHYYAVRSGLQWATCGFDYKSRGWINVDMGGNPRKDEFVCGKAADQPVTTPKWLPRGSGGIVRAWLSPRSAQPDDCTKQVNFYKCSADPSGCDYYALGCQSTSWDSTWSRTNIAGMSYAKLKGLGGPAERAKFCSGSPGPSPSPRPSTGKCCMESCQSTSECAANMFCCPNHKKCFDRTTGGSWGVNCDACKAGPSPSPPPPSPVPQPTPRPSPAPLPSGWTAHPSKYLGGYVSGVGSKKFDPVTARSECVAKGSSCGGVTCKGDSCTLRAGRTLKNSGSETSWTISR